jgi:hypothetical protein
MIASDAIVLGDGRELWVVDPDFTIMNFVDEFCMTPKGATAAPQIDIVTATCDEEDE